MIRTESLWVYLSASPLLWLTVTLGTYVIADRLSRMSGRNPLVNPVLLSIIMLSVLLWISNTRYET
jgi:putative effector of murein hydrolase